MKAKLVCIPVSATRLGSDGSLGPLPEARSARWGATRWAPWMASLLIASVSGPVAAQSARSGGAGNAQLVQQLQQLASERTALQAENTRMKKELAELAKERDALKAGRAALDQRARATEATVARSTQEKARAEDEAEKLKARMQELIARFRETAQTLKDVEGERATVAQSLTAREGELKACVDRNAALYSLNTEILARLEKDGVLSRMARAEPFTKLKRVQLENLADDYRYRAQEQKLPQPAPSQPATAVAPESVTSR